MDNPTRIFWGDSHHQSYIPVQDPPLGEVLAQASRYLDFYSGAYYMKEFAFAPVLAAPPIACATSRGHLHDQPVGDSPVLPRRAPGRFQRPRVCWRCSGPKCRRRPQRTTGPAPL